MIRPGVFALVLALTQKPRKAELLPVPSAAEPPWPEGFVEWTVLPVESAAPSSSDTARPPATGSAPK